MPGAVIRCSTDQRLASPSSSGPRGPLSVRSLMGPLLGEFRRIMGPALSQHDGATREGGVTRLSQGHGSSSEAVFAASWGQSGLSDLK